MRRGFTAIELVVIVALVALSLYFIINVFQRARDRATLDASARAIASLIEKAHTDTLAGKGGYAYGVHMQSDRAVLFRGVTYSASENTNISEMINPTLTMTTSLQGGGSDIKFERLSGKTNQYGTTTLSLLNEPTRVKYIVVTQSGAVTVK